MTLPRFAPLAFTSAANSVSASDWIDESIVNSSCAPGSGALSASGLSNIGCPCAS